MPRPSIDATSAAGRAHPRHSCPPVVRSKAMHMLHKISHVQLADFQKIDGVKHYVLNIYEKPSRRRTAGPSSQVRRLTEFSSTASGASSAVEPLDRKPMLRVVKRFRDFEELRKQLQRSLSGTRKNGECSCCDAFTTFLSCRSMQPGLLVKLTKCEADRKVLLEQFINQVIRLAVLESGAASHHHLQAACAVKDQVPGILEQFLQTTTQQKTQKLGEASEASTSLSSISAA